MVSATSDDGSGVKNGPEMIRPSAPLKNKQDHGQNDDPSSDHKSPDRFDVSIKSETEELKLDNASSDSGCATPEYDESRKIKQSRMKRQALKDTPRQLFNELPSVTDQALKTFTPLAENVYTLKNLGDSGQEEFMSCDCKPYYPDSTGINHACGEDSDCINRLTSIECLMDSPDHPNNCGKACSNQRMQRCQYAPVDVIQTAQKGFGLRALQDIQANTFVYEYIGEIINQDRFVKRTQAYQQQGVKHFYFMMLQKNEFIDATQKGCLARFCNHSCNPNSYVDKWIVGSKLRMGIFAKRTVLKGEEITFDYNVDRYGADAQKCYCGEPNCIGYLGGKTQTDSVNKLPQMIIDALGLTESDEKLFIKKKISVIKEYQSLQATQQSISGSQQQQLSQETLDKIYDDLLPIKEIHEDTVSRTMGSLIQCKDAWLVRKLVKRIFITDDTSIHLKVIRMHGYEIFSKLLRNWSQPESLNKDVIVMILRILKKWPKMTRNKISSSKIEDIIKSFTVDFKPVKEEEVKIEDVQNEEDGDVELHTIKDVYTLAQGLIEDWSNLQMAYRIPRRERTLAQSLLLEDPNNNSIEDSENRNTAGIANTIAGNKSSTSLLGTPSPSISATSASTQNIPTGPRASKSYTKNNSSMDSMGLLARDPELLIGSNVPTGPKLPSGWKRMTSEDNRVYYCHIETNQNQWDFPTAFSGKKANNKNPRYDEKNGYKNKNSSDNFSNNNEDISIKTASQQQTDLQKIIEEANLQVQLKAQLATLALEKSQKEEQERRKKIKLDILRQKERERSGKVSSSKPAKNLAGLSSAASSSVPSSSSSTPTVALSSVSNLSSTEQAYTKLFARYVPNFIKKYESQLSHDLVKRHAKDIVKVLAAKEMKLHNVKSSSKKVPKSFDEKKLLKIKHFSREYMEKVMKHYGNKQAKDVSGTATPIAAVETLTLSSDGDTSQLSTRAPTPVNKRSSESLGEFDSGGIDSCNGINSNDENDTYSPTLKLARTDHSHDVKTHTHTHDKDDNEIDFDD